MPTVKEEDVKGYVSRVNYMCEKEGVSHVVVKIKPDGSYIIACMASTANLNGTLSLTPKTTLCYQCKRRIIK